MFKFRNTWILQVFWVACGPFPELCKELQHQQELAELRQLFPLPLHLCVLTVLTRGRRCVYSFLALFPDDCLIHTDYSQLASTFIPKKGLVVTVFLITQFYTKLEEKHKALEAEKDEAEARKKVRAYFWILFSLAIRLL